MSEATLIIDLLRQERRWLREAIARQPQPWHMSRLAEVEGQLARFREQRAWKTTREILDRLRRPAR